MLLYDLHFFSSPAYSMAVKSLCGEIKTSDPLPHLSYLSLVPATGVSLTYSNSMEHITRSRCSGSPLAVQNGS